MLVVIILPIFYGKNGSFFDLKNGVCKIFTRMGSYDHEKHLNLFTIVSAKFM